MEKILYIALFFMLLAAGNTIVMNYQRANRGKAYVVQRKTADLLWNLAYINAAWVGMHFLANDGDAGIGWWLLSFALGVAVTAACKAVTERSCEKMWPKREDATVEEVLMPKWANVALNAGIIVIELCLAAGFCYALCTGKAEGAKDIAVFVLCILMFLGGAYFNGQMLRKELGK